MVLTIAGVFDRGLWEFLGRFSAAIAAGFLFVVTGSRHATEQAPIASQGKRRERLRLIDCLLTVTALTQL